MDTEKCTDGVRRGVSLFEVVVAVSIIALVVLSVVVAFQFYVREGLASLERVQAVALAEEGIEAIRFLRDEGWDAHIATLATDTSYHLVFSAAGWEATTTPQTVDGTFTRLVTLRDVYRRDSDDDIVASTTAGSSIDPDARHVIVEVTWTDAASSTRSAHLENIVTDLWES